MVGEPLRLRSVDQSHCSSGPSRRHEARRTLPGDTLRLRPAAASGRSRGTRASATNRRSGSPRTEPLPHPEPKIHPPPKHRRIGCSAPGPGLLSAHGHPAAERARGRHRRGRGQLRGRPADRQPLAAPSSRTSGRSSRPSITCARSCTSATTPLGRSTRRSSTTPSSAHLYPGARDPDRADRPRRPLRGLPQGRGAARHRLAARGHAPRSCAASPRSARSSRRT